MQATRHSILEAVRDRVSAAVASGGADPAIIFDLDGTLAENTPRTQRILLAFALERGDEPLRQRLESVPVACYRYRIGDTLERLGVNGREREEIERYWQRHFFSDRFLRFDTPLDGAPRYLRRLHAEGAHIIYLTGRDVPNMLAGTSVLAIGFDRAARGRALPQADRPWMTACSGRRGPPARRPPASDRDLRQRAGGSSDLLAACRARPASGRRPGARQVSELGPRSCASPASRARTDIRNARRLHAAAIAWHRARARRLGGCGDITYIDRRGARHREDPLALASVVVLGTGYGAVSGRTAASTQAGRYSVKASYIGSGETRRVTVGQAAASCSSSARDPGAERDRGRGAARRRQAASTVHGRAGADPAHAGGRVLAVVGRQAESRSTTTRPVRGSRHDGRCMWSTASWSGLHHRPVWGGDLSSRSVAEVNVLTGGYSAE
jgi:hypothetical protein